MNKPAVSVFSYTDYRVFLKKWFEEATKLNAWLSHRSFITRAGYKSPSMLNNVIKGQRHLTVKSARRFGEVMQLENEELQFFVELVRYATARSTAEKAYAWSVITGYRHFKGARKLERQHYQFMSSWYLPAIYELSYRDDFCEDSQWIIDALMFPLTAEQAAEALVVLQELDLLHRDDSGRLRAQKAQVITPDMIFHLYATLHHQQMLEKALEALEGHPPKEQVFFGSNLPLPAFLFDEVKGLMREVFNRVILRCDEERESGACVDRVYRLQLQFFPLSHKRQ